MKNTKKKGFTLVELVIVIAVIAILAGVLIGTFAGVISRANQSKALQELRAEITEMELAFAVSGTTMPEEDMVFEKNGFYFLYDYDATAKKAELVTTTATASASLLKNPTKLASGITLWRNGGAILDVTKDYYEGGATTGTKIWNGNTSSDKRGVGVITGAMSNMASHKITVKNEDGKVVGEDSGTDATCTWGIYDGKTNLSSYGKGYFTYEVVVTFTDTTPAKTYTGVFYIE